jgi:hypothetical protein
MGKLAVPTTVLSKHAADRIRERFRVQPEAIVALMNAGLGKRVGVSRETNVIHHLLWIPVDECMLVAIQEVVSGVVRTVLTLDMYRRDYEKNLSEERIRFVVNEMVHSGHAPLTLWLPGKQGNCVLVYAHMTDGPVVSLGQWKGKVDSIDLTELGNRDQFWIWVARRLIGKDGSLERLTHIEARFRGGQTCEIPFSL